MDLKLQDLLFDIEGFTEVDFEGFKFERVVSRPFERDEKHVMVIGIEHNPDLVVISRETVTLTHAMTDLGGLIEVLFVSSAIVVQILNY